MTDPGAGQLEPGGACLLGGNDPGSYRCVYTLRGPEGVVHFVYSDWHPDAPDEVRAIDTKFMISFGHPLMPMGMDVGYHSPAPMNHYQLELGAADEACMWLDGHPCWGDGSALRGMETCREWMARGRDMEWLFNLLADYYNGVFRSNGHGPLGLMELTGVVFELLRGELP